MLCNEAVNFLHKKLRNRNYKFIPSQSDEGKEIINKFSLAKVSQESIVLIKDNSILIKSDAILNIVDDMPKIWHIAKVFKILPKNIRDIIYTWISENRHKIFRN